jgi:two-component system, chemotaxis family, protein-glutamate methylesterase/glutaminase
MEQISVLIVDDSALMRNVISKIIEETPDLYVAGRAMNGKFALQKIPKLKPDFIVLDLEMPEMNGIEFLKERKKRHIDIPVVILSSIARKGAQITMEALQLGASDFIMKPTETNSVNIKDVGSQLVELIRAYGKRTERPGRTAVAAEGPASRSGHPISVPERKEALKPHIIVLGISTGGPNALRHIFSELEGSDLPPMLIVQHMPAGFTNEFAKSLDRISPLEIKEAQDGDLLKQGRVLIAPGNYHMIIEKKTLASVVRLTQTEQVNGHRPSADVLFSSAAQVFGNRVLAAIMTGMGRDGAAGIGKIYTKGGMTIAQDESSCIVYGMPRVAVEKGFIRQIVPLEKMAETLDRYSL